MSIRTSRRLSTISTDSVRLAIAISEVRKRLERDLLRKCSPHDAHHILREEWWVSTFLICYNCDVDVTVAVIGECLKWRMQFEVEHIGMLSVKEMLDKKAMYIHGADVEGNAILWCAMREHTNGDGAFQRLFVFWMERHFNQSHAAPITIFIDMTNTSFVNLDYDLFKFILHALKYYYPNCALDMLVFECPSRLAASWKVIKSWLDVGHPMVHLLSRDTVSQFIPLCSLPLQLGGEDHFVFTMDDLARCIPSREPILEEMFYENGDVSPTTLDNFPTKRSVKFESEDEEVVTRSAPLTLGVPSGLPPTRSRSTSKTRRSQLPSALRSIAERRVHAAPSEWAVTESISICPRDELHLTSLPNHSSTDLIDVVAIRNTSDRTLIYKIKTTSPEKFRVRPSNGQVSPGGTEIVRVSLQQEYKNTAARDKFLLMAVCTDTATPEQFAQVWSTSAENEKMEVKLRCRVVEDSNAAMLSSCTASSAEEESLREQLLSLTNNQRLLTIFVAFLVLLQFVCILNERSNNASLRLAIQTLSTATNKHQNSDL